MKALWLVLILSVFAAPQLLSQQLNSREVYGGYVFARDNEILTLNELIRENPRGSELNRLFRSARRNKLWGGALAFAGAFTLGTALADTITGNDDDDSLNDWRFYVAGAALIVVSIPLSSAADKRVQSAVQLYNTGAGLGLGINF